jgi:hypothetical protein
MCKKTVILIKIQARFSLHFKISLRFKHHPMIFPCSDSSIEIRALKRAQNLLVHELFHLCLDQEIVMQCINNSF